jgi:hypothetical protein
MVDKVMVLYCEGPDGKPHDRRDIARYVRYDIIWREADQWPRVWRPVRSWSRGEETITVPEFERWVTDDNDDSMLYGPLSLPLRRQFRYRCEGCSLDAQRHTDNHEVDVEAAHETVLNALTDRGREDISVRDFVTLWEYQLSRTRRE